MGEQELSEAEPDEGELPPSKLVAWTRRRTLGAVKRQLADEETGPSPWDVKLNEMTRLPDGQSVHLGGLVLVEAFPPSMITSLGKRLKGWRTDTGTRNSQWVHGLERSRVGSSGGWWNLGVVRPPGTFLATEGRHDSSLPAGVDAVHLRMSYLTPSLSMLAATFTFSEEAGDLSSVLRTDFTTRNDGVTIRIDGRLAPLRERLPWSRPMHYSAWASTTSGQTQKKETCEARMRGLQDACHKWLAKNFPGRFAACGASRRPIIRVMFTSDGEPFKRASAELSAAGLAYDSGIWRSTSLPGWSLCTTLAPHQHAQNVMVFAARRAEVATSANSEESTDSIWYLMQDFEQHQIDLAIRYSVIPLLSLYSERLSQMRDRAGTKRLVRFPVAEARKLDRFLIADGLDAKAVTGDMRLLTGDRAWRWAQVVDYREDFDDYPPQVREKYPPRELLSALQSLLQVASERLTEDTETTTGNVRASADLRQAIANTRLQRATLLLAVVAIVISIVTALH